MDEETCRVGKVFSVTTSDNNNNNNKNSQKGTAPRQSIRRRNVLITFRVGGATGPISVVPFWRLLHQDTVLAVTTSLPHLPPSYSNNLFPSNSVVLASRKLAPRAAPSHQISPSQSVRQAGPEASARTDFGMDSFLNLSGRLGVRMNKDISILSAS